MPKGIGRIRDQFNHLTKVQMDLVEEILGKYTSDDLVLALERVSDERKHYEASVHRYNKALDEKNRFDNDVKTAEHTLYEECVLIAREVVDQHTVVRDLRGLLGAVDTGIDK